MAWAARSCSSSVIGLPSSSVQRRADGLHLRVLVQRLEALLATEPAALEAAERRLDGERTAVHGHLPGVELLRDPQAAREVAAPDAGDEPVLRVVAARDCVG